MPRSKVISALGLVRSAISYPGMPRRKLALLGAMIAEIAEELRPRRIGGAKFDVAANHTICKSTLDAIVRARKKLIDSIEFTSPSDTVDVFDQIVTTSYAIKKLRIVIDRLFGVAYQRDERLLMSSEYYKGRFLIAVYLGDELIDVYMNAKEMSAKIGIPEATVRVGLSNVFRGERSRMEINGKKHYIYFISAFD